MHGMQTQKRFLPRMTCFFGQITLLVALMMTGIFYTIVFLAKDSIQVLEIFENDPQNVFIQEETALIAKYLLFDQNFIQTFNLTDTLAFSDTLRVPPHPTPFFNDPIRYDVDFLYTFQELQKIRQVCEKEQEDQAIIELFGWEETFLQEQWKILKEMVFFGSDVKKTTKQISSSPYHHTNLLMNSTLDQLIDPDNDTIQMTNKDQLEIQKIFNLTWDDVEEDTARYQNELIKDQWFFTAQIYSQKLRLKKYTQKIVEILDATNATIGKVVTERLCRHM
jgi:hypothetical protein